MNLSLPGNYLYYLSRDNLAPEEYERIISAYAAWSRICREYEFDDGYNASRYLINMREGRTYHTPASSRGSREKEKLEKMVFSGEIVMLSDIYRPAGLFHINDDGKLICADPLAFHLNGVEKIIQEYTVSVKRRDYRHSGGKPRSTQIQRLVRTSAPDLPAQQALRTINTKAAGRLLAAGGGYNGNVEGYAKVAKDLGGDADKGFEQVLNKQTAGAMLAAGALLGAKKGGAASIKQIDNLKAASTKEFKVVEIKAGEKGSWSKPLNKPSPNTIYKVDGNKVYHTDDQGRVKMVEADLTAMTKDRNTYQQRKAGKSGDSGDEGGHLLASIFDGPGEKLNLVPMDANLNKGAWKKMENSWAKALEDGKPVKVKINPIYTGDSNRPSSFEIKCTIGNERPVVTGFKNVSGGQ
ncbi:HNH endonuclease domain-containing protein [Yersinia enterocolitica]|uniref:DNA/RNA non-specific endonuclease n=1 Tax=Yersinia enterocolitica TaxID=630 RepID=UPI0005E566D2|nr:DNA/RNA non-specific endonuclease [Yersinia enterocolitica]CNK65880.1 HNH endonuclease domain-containing protein [Yersinia enterocolitica]